MFTITARTEPGDANKDNEDWYAATDDVVIVLDGATIRTGTGCVHGLPWYVRQLGGHLLAGSADPSTDLRTVLANAIHAVSASHASTCDLGHPGTPSAAVGMVRSNGDRLEWVVLGDITVMVHTPDELIVDADERVSQVGKAERRACDQYPLGSDEKMAAILAMKDVELAMRNVPGGYWIASVDPTAANQAVTGSAPLDQVDRFAACSDGAMRALTMTSVSTHAAALDVLSKAGPVSLIELVRASETRDATGTRWPRNKRTDDATAVVAQRGQAAQ